MDDNKYILAQSKLIRVNQVIFLRRLFELELTDNLLISMHLLYNI